MFFKIRDTLGRQHFVNSEHIVDITHGTDPDGNPRYEILLSTSHAVNINWEDFKKLNDLDLHVFSLNDCISKSNRS
jgi:hypothetical protein